MTQTAESFRFFRLRGGRYEGRGFPLESLPELYRYERLISDVAKKLWKQRHPNRQRLPRGFANALQLQLVDIEEGSIVPVLQRSIDVRADGSITEVAGLFDEAKSIVEETFAAIVDGSDFPEVISDAMLSEFVRFGSTLRDNERVEFQRNGSGRFVYNQHMRRRLQARTATERLTIEGVIAGKVIALDTSAQAFTLVDLRGRTINGHYLASTLTQDFLQLLNTVTLASFARLEGTFSATVESEIVEVQDVKSIELFEFPDSLWSSRLIQLADLRAGWLDGQGEAVSFAALDFAREILREITETKTIPAPGIFPTPEGGVQLEWQLPRTVASVEISSDLEVALFRVDTTTHQEDEAFAENVGAAVLFIREATSA